MTIVFFTDEFDSCLEEKKMLDQKEIRNNFEWNYIQPTNYIEL